jgi:antitoxin component YwqK of YwqJK toxin-antitoxin module
MIKVFSKVLFINLIVLFGCGSGDTVSNKNASLSSIPSGAEVIDLGDIQKVLIKGQDGKIIEEGNAINGLKEGSWISYNEAGVPVSLITYHQGIKHGVVIDFDNNGSITFKAYYVGDQLEGELRNYQNRNLYEIKTYEGGVLNGPHLTFYSNEKVQQEVYYVDGKYDGLARWFNQEGELTIAYIYDDGELVDKNPTLSAEDSVASF